MQPRTASGILTYPAIGNLGLELSLDRLDALFDPLGLVEALLFVLAVQEVVLLDVKRLERHEPNVVVFLL